MSSPHLQSAINVFWVLINIAAVVGIVMANKLVFTHFKFHFGTLLTVIHFVFTSAGLELGKLVGWIPKKQVEWWRVIPLSVSFCGFVVLTNLSLQYNSVGFYQMAKVMTTPIMAGLQFAFYSARFSRPVLACLAVICAGCIFATATEVQLTLVGLLIALAACSVTAIYSIWVETEQKRLGLNAMQLLSYQAPLSAAILVPLVPLLDNYKAIWPYRPSAMAIGAISLSSMLALLVNVSTFMIIGRMSALTYNVAGQAKMCLILVSGYIMFDAKKGLSWLNISGVCIAMSGVIAYSFVKLAENKRKAEIKEPIPDEVEVEKEEIPTESIKKSLLIHNDLAKGKVIPVTVLTKPVTTAANENEPLVHNENQQIRV